MKKKTEFNKQRVASTCKISNEVLRDEKLRSGTDGDDFIQDQLTFKLEAQFLSHMAERRVIMFACDKPKFLDWLLGRHQIAKFEFKICDVLINPPKLKKGTHRIVIITEEE